jgi:electron transfer flavoprotein beta subunit
MAMGADRAIHVQTDEDLAPIAVARIFHALAQKEQPGLILVGKQAIDDDSATTGSLLSAMGNMPQGTFASSVTLSDDKKSVTVVRDIDAGSETVSLTLPAVITCDLRLNQPRYATLPNIMKAKKKPLETITPADLKVNTASGLKILSVEEPPKRAGGIKVASVDELISKLKAAQVL